MERGGQPDSAEHREQLVTFGSLTEKKMTNGIILNQHSCTSVWTLKFALQVVYYVLWRICYSSLFKFKFSEYPATEFHKLHKSVKIYSKWMLNEMLLVFYLLAF